MAEREQKAEWEQVAINQACTEEVHRLRVPGGWLYRVRELGRIDRSSVLDAERPRYELNQLAMSVVFVPDPISAFGDVDR